jgi:hypothetical protein
MPDPKNRARVIRLLSDDFRPGDLTDLFLFARDHCDGRETVADIGDFVAHHLERDRGITTRSTREWFVSAKFHMARFGANGTRQLHASRLPSAAQEYFRIAVNRIEAKIIKQQAGFKRAKAYDTMNIIADRMIRNHDGTWCLPANLQPAELRLVECVSSFLVTRPAFEEAQLVDDFVATLKSNGLITTQEIRAHQSVLAAVVPLFAISVIHNSEIILKDGTKTRLIGRADEDGLHVSSHVPTAIPGYPDILVATSMFVSGLDPAVHCSPPLRWRTWNFEIELGPDKRLTQIG